MYLIDGPGGGCALFVRMHHCIADGIALARVMLTLTDPSPTTMAAGQSPRLGDASGPRRAADRGASATARRHRRRGTRESRRSCTPAAWPRSPVDAAREVPALTRSSCSCPSDADSSDARRARARPAGSPGRRRSTSSRSRRSPMPRERPSTTFCSRRSAGRCAVTCSTTASGAEHAGDRPVQPAPARASRSRVSSATTSAWCS